MKTPKYRNEPTVVDGIRFPSKREARRYCVLLLLAKAGEIEDLERQPRYPLIVEQVAIATYVGDFAYKERGQPICEDVKGMATDLFKLKARLFTALYPHIQLKIT